jgi:signal transduction histidine kinase
MRIQSQVDLLSVEEVDEIFEDLRIASSRFFLSKEPQDTYRIIVEEAKRLLEADYGSLFLWKNSKLERVYTSFPQLYKVIPRKNGRTVGVIMNQEPLLYDISADRDHPMLHRLGVRFVVSFPLLYADKAIGVVNMLFLHKNFHGGKDLGSLKLFGTLAGLAVHKAETYFDLRNSLENLEAYLSMASHEIKTPLTAIQAFIQLLQKKGLTTDAFNNYAIMHKLSAETKRMSQLIDEFLGKEESIFNPNFYVWKQCSLRELIDRACSDFSLLYPNHTLVLKDGFISENDHVWGDFDKLLQVFINVLNNAGKYSQSGSEVVISLKPSGKNFLVVIKDQGAGIRREDIKKIFEKFYRGSNQSQKGMGLGLYLVKTIVDNHKGVISIHSSLNKGTIVRIQLPRFLPE